MNTKQTHQAEAILDEELAAECIRSNDLDLRDLGRALQEAVDAERDGSVIRERIEAHIAQS